MDGKIHTEFDKADIQIRKFLSHYGKSTIIQNCFLDEFESLFYGTLINNFFLNLGQKSIKEYNLPKGQIDIIKRKYNDVQKDLELTLASSFKNKKIDKGYYNNFKLTVETDFPEFKKIISEIENEIEGEKVKDYWLKCQFGARTIERKYPVTLML